MNVAEFVLQRLGEWGLQRIYGYPGDGIAGIDLALERAKDRMQFVQVRHEEMAAFMACAHAKFTGEAGVCLATSGPGAIHLTSRTSSSRWHPPRRRSAVSSTAPCGSHSTSGPPPAS